MRDSGRCGFRWGDATFSRLVWFFRAGYQGSGERRNPSLDDASALQMAGAGGPSFLISDLEFLIGCEG